LVINPLFENQFEKDINKMWAQFEKEKSNVYQKEFFFQ
jgi:TATA-binding protein-associated factor Taf7